MVLVQLEGLDQLKNPMTSGIEPATFWLSTEQNSLKQKQPTQQSSVLGAQVSTGIIVTLQGLCDAHDNAMCSTVAH
jgi:hypothetical protein